MNGEHTGVASSGSYTYSHTACGKGRSYDHAYQSDPLRRYFWTQEQRILRQILNEFFSDCSVDLLDFACGTGRIVSALEHEVTTATGIDVSETMLEVAREKVRRAHLIKGNLLLEALFPPGSFNLITAFRFFVNAEEELRLRSLRALGPLLRENGYLVFNNHQNRDSLYMLLARAYARWKGLRPPNMLSVQQCRDLLAVIGFEIIRIYPVGSLHLPRIALPRNLYQLVDRVASLCPVLAVRSESPVLVARRCRN